MTYSKFLYFSLQKFIYQSFIVFSFSLFCNAQDHSLTNPLLYFLPKVTDKAHFVIHSAFALEYSHKNRDPLWVVYFLTSAETLSKGKRHGEFQPDHAVPGGTADLSDFRNSGYDRGHQAPAADFKWSFTAEEESFLLSNICPQNQNLNRGLWEHLENHIRRWAKQYDKLYIVTGPLLDTCIDYIGRNRVCVPRGFFKVILDCSDHNNYQSIAFIMRNSDLPETDSLQSYAVPVDSVEKITGIHFFSNFPVQLEKNIDASFNLSHWSF